MIWIPEVVLSEHGRASARRVNFLGTRNCSHRACCLRMYNAGNAQHAGSKGGDWPVGRCEDQGGPSIMISSCSECRVLFLHLSHPIGHVSSILQQIARSQKHPVRKICESRWWHIDNASLLPRHSKGRNAKDLRCIPPKRMVPSMFSPQDLTHIARSSMAQHNHGCRGYMIERAIYRTTSRRIL